MKINKKAYTICAFIIGTALFTSSAFADMLIGSGYISLKDGIKNTSNILITEKNNFTIDAKYELKADGKSIENSHVIQKYDLKNMITEYNEVVSSVEGEERRNYSYEDRNQIISYKMNTGIYDYRRKYDNDYKVIEDPFQDESVNDAEKIFDAFVGSLGDAIQIEEFDNEKIYSGNLSQSQIPALVNALASYAIKYEFINDNKSADIPTIKNDLCVNNISGKAVQDAEGLIKSIIISGSINGKDENDFSHIISIDIILNIKDVNSTNINYPDLRDKNVVISEESSSPSFGSEYVGTYKSNIQGNELYIYRKQTKLFLWYYLY